MPKEGFICLAMQVKSLQYCIATDWEIFACCITNPYFRGIFKCFIFSTSSLTIFDVVISESAWFPGVREIFKLGHLVAKSSSSLRSLEESKSRSNFINSPLILSRVVNGRQWEFSVTSRSFWDVGS